MSQAMNILSIREMRHDDVAAAVDIDRQSFKVPWSGEEFFDSFKGKNIYSMVAVEGAKVVGCYVIRVRKTSLSLMNLAVDPAYRFQGVGTAMIADIFHRTHQTERRSIVAEVSDENVAAHLFLKNFGFNCIAIINGGETLRFQYQVPVRGPA